MQHYDSQVERDEEGGWFQKLNPFRRTHEEDDEEYEEGAPAAGGSAPSGGGGARAYQPRSGPGATRPSTFRIASTREASITVMPVASFGDIQKVADRLKGGEPQIINLEKTPAEVADRLIDFLNGVTYALDGFVEKISEGAYLFTPSHITIHADGPEQTTPQPPKASIFERT